MAQTEVQKHMRKVIDLLKEGGRRKEITDEDTAERLKALQTMGEETVRAVIAYKENQKHQPGGVVIKTATQLDEIFGCKLQGITLQPNSFEVALPNREEWRPYNGLE